jgi:hypothetical protein
MVRDSRIDIDDSSNRNRLLITKSIPTLANGSPV